MLVPGEIVQEESVSLYLEHGYVVSGVVSEARPTELIIDEWKIGTLSGSGFVYQAVAYEGYAKKPRLQISLDRIVFRVLESETMWEDKDNE